MSANGDPDALAAHVLAKLLSRSHLLEPGAVSETIADLTAPLGVRAARNYLSDLQQHAGSCRHPW